jgi:hypothetical protein
MWNESHRLSRYRGSSCTSATNCGSAAGVGHAFANGHVDSPRGARCERDGDHLAALRVRRAHVGAEGLRRPILLRQLGVPKGFPLTAGDGRIIADFIDSFFPVAPKTKGVAFDAFAADPDVNSYPLEALTVPTLIVHAKDDPSSATPQPGAPPTASPAPGLSAWSGAGTCFSAIGRTSAARSPPSWAARFNPRAELLKTGAGAGPGGGVRHRCRRSHDLPARDGSGTSLAPRPGGPADLAVCSRHSFTLMSFPRSPRTLQCSVGTDGVSCRASRRDGAGHGGWQ